MFPIPQTDFVLLLYKLGIYSSHPLQWNKSLYSHVSHEKALVMIIHSSVHFFLSKNLCTTYFYINKENLHIFGLVYNLELSLLCDWNKTKFKLITHQYAMARS